MGADGRLCDVFSLSLLAARSPALGLVEDLVLLRDDRTFSAETEMLAANFLRSCVS